MRAILLLLTITILFCACESSEPEISQNTLQGYWVKPEYTEMGTTYRRSSDFDEGAGMALLSEGKLLQRANSGWCGTPPISYTEYEGSWVQQDSTILATSAYWGGQVDFRFKILEINSQTLRIETLSTDYE